ncbi:Glycine-tRNA ligase [Macleaya cordata]|uniref:glycine--tRNA ligase n=1 Tax=Macleaya cordata TaxID=56857 RepID=A0A200QJI1_MACCD|nr:Glycine-tRNA ligase [Macleaya cordata]
MRMAGIDVNEHDIRFVEDNWESPVLGAWGLGWEVWMDGMEITQFTYFQQAGSLQLSPISVEITYGLERILMLLQGVDHFKKIQYADGITYGELFSENEKEMSAYYLEHASVNHIQKHFEFFEEEARSLLSLGLAIPAYDQLLKTSHAFNILDSRGFVGVTERARYFGRMRSLARQCAQLWVKTRESLGHPLGIVSEPNHLVCPKDVVEIAKRKVPDDPQVFVLEIGTEEMPPQDVVDASQQLKDLVVQLLEKQRLSHGEVFACGTPRRLVVLVGSLCSKQVANEVEVRGPPVVKAFDQQGNPTKAAEGFCRKYGASVDSLFKKTEGKTEYVYIRVMESAQLALEVLAEDLPATIAKISFPKSMRWNTQVMFSRPIRWILALHGDVVVPFSFAGVLSGSLSYGLRNTPSATVEVENAEAYVGVMKKAGLMVEIEERKKTILEHSNSLAESVGGRLILQNNLLEEVVNLVEAPIPILGKFKESFLELPKELLIMVMQKHQKYFPVTDIHGRLLPYFIAVANGAINENVVRKGNEAVLRARYEDAKFFYEMDTNKKFIEFRDQLKGILFHEKLGTMLDKMMRVQKTVAKLSLAMGIDEDKLPVVQDAASLAMSDLATAVVTEFTSLSGIMARHYALRNGYSEEIAEGLFEITLPRFSGDILPKTDAGIVLATADRLDSLLGLFGVGCQPSSTNDPFGLRRISYGLVQVLVENDKNLDLKNALRLAAEVQPIPLDGSTIDEVHQFVTRRLEQFLVDKGISPEVVRSVLLERANWPCLATKSAVKMDTLSRGELLSKVVEAYSRPTRIIRGKDVDADLEVNEDAFETNEERALWSAFLEVKAKIHPGVEVDDFVETSSQLLQPLEDFFNHVFVMADDERVRKNRLALLKKIADLPKGIADLSVLPGF